MLPNLIVMLWLEGSRPRFKGQFSILKSREPSLSFAMNFHFLNNRGLVMYEGNLLQSSNFTKVYHCIQSAESYDVLTVKIQHYFLSEQRLCAAFWHCTQNIVAPINSVFGQSTVRVLPLAESCGHYYQGPPHCAIFGGQRGEFRKLLTGMQKKFS